jgi:hypothetical protein
VNALRRHLQPLTWLALVAVLALALLPTVSHALPGNASSSWTEVCTTQGLQRVPTGAAVGDQSAPPGVTAHFDHCPFCKLGHDAPPLPQAPLVLSLAAPDGVYLPALFLQAPYGLHAWASAQPRAPPFLS